MKKLHLIGLLMAVFVFMMGVAYYFDESGETETAFRIARYMLIPFAIVVEIAFNPIRSLVKWVKSKTK